MTETTTATAERNRSIILQAYEGLFEKGDVDAIGALLREDYIEHKEGWPSGRDQAVAFLRNSPLPSAKVELLHVLADGDHIAVHAMTSFPAAGISRDVVDIWRFDGNGQIAEHWDVVHTE